VEEEQAGVLSCRLLPLLPLSVDVVEHGSPVIHIGDHLVQRAHDSVGLDMTVIGQERADIAEPNICIVGAAVPRQYQPPESCKRRMSEHFPYAVVGSEERPLTAAMQISCEFGSIVVRAQVVILLCFCQRGCQE
jgi:hypothetical protein